MGQTPFWIYVNRMIQSEDPTGEDLKLEFPERHWKNVSRDAQDFLRRVLKPNPMKRPTARKCLSHDWLKKSNRKAHYLGQTMKSLRELRENLKKGQSKRGFTVKTFKKGHFAGAATMQETDFREFKAGLDARSPPSAAGLGSM